MRIWAPPDCDRGMNAAHGVIIIVFAVMLLTISGSLLATIYKLGTGAMLALVFAATALAIALALRLGRRARRATLIFCMDTSRRLFYIDANLYARRRHGLSGYAAMNDEAQRAVKALTEPGGILERRLSEPAGLTGLETEILSVEKARYSRREIKLACRVRYRNGKEGRSRVLLVRGYPDEDLLLRELERLQVPEL